MEDNNMNNEVSELNAQLAEPNNDQSETVVNYYKEQFYVAEQKAEEVKETLMAEISYWKERFNDEKESSAKYKSILDGHDWAFEDPDDYCVIIGETSAPTNKGDNVAQKQHLKSEANEDQQDTRITKLTNQLKELEAEVEQERGLRAKVELESINKDREIKRLGEEIRKSCKKQKECDVANDRIAELKALNQELNAKLSKLNNQPQNASAELNEQGVLSFLCDLGLKNSIPSDERSINVADEDRSEAENASMETIIQELGASTSETIFSKFTTQLVSIVNEYVKRAVSAKKEGNFEHALGLLYDAIVIEAVARSDVRGMSILWNYIGLIFGKMKRYDYALNCYDKALGYSSFSASVHYNRAYACFVLEEFEKAKECITGCLILNPDHEGAKSLKEKIDQELDP